MGCRYLLVLIALGICVPGTGFWEAAALPGNETVKQTADLSIRFMHIKPQVEDPWLTAHWAFDEGSGYQASDASGREATAWLGGEHWNTEDCGLTASLWKPGRRGWSVHLNGTQWLQVRQAPHLEHAGEQSLNLWVMPQEKVSGWLVGNLSPSGGYALSVLDNGALAFEYMDSLSERRVLRSDPGLVVVGAWQMVGVSFSPRNGLLRFSLNGNAVGDYEIPALPMKPSQTDLFIGGAPGMTRGLLGRVDEVSLFSRALEEQDWASLYVSGLPRAYLQSRETIDAGRSEWSRFRGNEPIPHPVEEASLMNLRFDGDPACTPGRQPLKSENPLFVPGFFGGALDGSSLRGGLCYDSPYHEGRGTIELWVALSDEKGGPVFRLEGKEMGAEIHLSSSDVVLVYGPPNNRSGAENLRVSGLNLQKDLPIHLALSWDGPSGAFRLFLNGAPLADEGGMKAALPFGGKIWIGGNKTESFLGLVDDVALSSGFKDWGEVCPRGHVATESPAMDLMLGFNHREPGRLFHWRPGQEGAYWTYGEKAWDHPEEAGCIVQEVGSGIQTLYHPDAFGHDSSVEASISVDSLEGGWVGVFVHSPGPETRHFSGGVFAVDFLNSRLWLATIRDGRVVREKEFKNDFEFQEGRVYQLTLSAVGGVLRGYVDNRNVASMISQGEDAGRGYAGLFTLDGRASFDDVHFKAITPATVDSRRIEMRMIGTSEEIAYADWGFHAFRWKKRHGQVPWERHTKNPEPPGNIFGPDAQTSRPNPSSFWRSQDAANSALILVNGTFYYFLRGNPTIGGRHGNAQIGVLWTEDRHFDGLRFTDPTLEESGRERNWVLQGHPDTNREGCSDEPPRHERFQLNDQGVVYLDGKILMVCREFRNRNPHSNPFRRLVMALFDPEKRQWTNPLPQTVSWSSMNPDSCYAGLYGINATPELALLRDPVDDGFVVLLYHGMTSEFRAVHESTQGHRYNAVSGFSFDGETLHPHPAYPEKESVYTRKGDLLFGERVLFDNGIWYMHANAHSERLVRDWPDRFSLYAALDPYEGAWVESRDSQHPERPYFERGRPFDPDNGAIWQGTMLRYRNRYYMYYENYHVIDNVEEMYEQYDHLQTGSRVGYSTAN
jgi:hypothetical protein